MVLGWLKQFVIDHLIIRQKIEPPGNLFSCCLFVPQHYENAFDKLHSSVIPFRKTKDYVNFAMLVLSNQNNLRL